MRVVLADDVREGRAIDVRGRSIRPDALLDAIREDDGFVECPRPGRMYDHVGRLEPDMHLSLRAALAAAARSRGLRSSYDEKLDELDREIASIEVESVDLAAARERKATAGADVAALRERVARLRGRLEAAREAGRETGEASAELRDAITALSEAETAELAAEQALDRAEREARAARDERERRLALVDERENLARRARAELARREFPRFRRGIAALPARTPVGAEHETFDGDDFVAGMAVARIASVRAPIVLADGPFDEAVTARAALDAPVVLV